MRTQQRTSLNRSTRSSRSRERGATLVVGLILLLVLTLLGVSGMNTATLEVTMAGNTQFQQDAFQAAETGIDLSISLVSDPADPPQVVPPTALGDLSYSTQATKTCVFAEDGAPHRTFSPNVVKSWYFDITATGTGPRNARSTHTQSFYKMGPFTAATCP